jgi:tetratricopeptide (TPR) repeat protein
VKSVLLVVLVLLSGWGGLTRIRDRNAAVQEGAAAYAQQNFAAAIKAYRRAVRDLGTKDEAIVLNLAHAYTRAGRQGDAKAYYGRLLTSKTPAMRSIAQQQLAVLAVQDGEFAQAITLLRLALLADPTNAEARYNYEVLRDYLARRPNAPRIPPPANSAPAPNPEQRTPAPQNAAQQSGSRQGNKRRGQVDEPNLPPNSQNAPQTQPSPSGQMNRDQPSTNPGNTARGGFQPGAGPERSVARGSTPGTVRGLSDASTGEESAQGRSSRAGTEAATLDETELQTQRARLEQMQLSPGRARQILESLGAAEQQYLQQLPRRSARKPSTDKPAW